MDGSKDETAEEEEGGEGSCRKDPTLSSPGGRARQEIRVLSLVFGLRSSFPPTPNGAWRLSSLSTSRSSVSSFF